MKKNKIIKITCIAIISLCIIVLGIVILKKDTSVSKPNKNSSGNEKVTPLLYEVTKEGSDNKIYLFGSIHVANTSKMEFPDYLINAYNNSNYIACEFNSIEYQNNQENTLNDVMKMMYQDGTTIKDHLDSKTYEKLVNFLKSKKNYSELYDVYKPFFFESLLSLQLAKDAKINTNDGIDEYFLKKATSDKKNILEVESPSFQIDLSISFDDSLYEIMFNETIDDYDKEVQNLKDLYSAWSEGNEEKLLKLIDDGLEEKDKYSKEEIKMIEDYNKKMLDDRNKGMTEKAIEYFNSKKDVFYMVGAAHIIGENGIAKSLEQKGYTIKRVN